MDSPERVVRKLLEMDERIELWEESPSARGAACDAREDGEEERMVLREPLHPRPPLVVDEQHGDALARLDEEDARVEQVGHEGRRPEGHR